MSNIEIIIHELLVPLSLLSILARLHLLVHLRNRRVIHLGKLFPSIGLVSSGGGNFIQSKMSRFKNLFHARVGAAGVFSFHRCRGFRYRLDGQVGINGSCRDPEEVEQVRTIEQTCQHLQQRSILQGKHLRRKHFKQECKYLTHPFRAIPLSTFLPHNSSLVSHLGWVASEI